MVRIVHASQLCAHSSTGAMCDAIWWFEGITTRLGQRTVPLSQTWLSR